MISRIYRDRLSFLQKKAYDALVGGFKKMKKEVKVLGKDIDSLDSIVKYIRLDYPWMFYLGELEYIVNPSWHQTEVIPKYLYSAQDIASLNSQLLTVHKKLLSYITGNTVWEKLLSAHDILCSSLDYRQAGIESYSIIGPYLHKQSVCEGIAKCFKAICDSIDIESCIVIGRAKSSFDARYYEAHSWNQVNIDGDWVNIDVTFDLTLSDKNFIRHDYFCVSDSQIRFSHIKTVDNGIKCMTDRYDYFIVNGLIMETQNSFIDFLKVKLQQGVSLFEIKLPNVSDIANVENKILINIQKALQALGLNRRFEISGNKDLMVFFIKIY